MFRIFILTFLILFLGVKAQISAQESYETYKVKGDKAYDLGKYADATGFYIKAFQLGTPDPGDAYNLVCCFALLKDSQNAFKYLDLAIQSGWTNDEWMQNDKDLEYLRNLPDWALYLEKTKNQKQIFESGINKALRNELLSLEKADQDLRKEIADLVASEGPKSPAVLAKLKQLDAVDSQNLSKLKTIIIRFGWPDIPLVGKDGSHAAFLIIQHADKDLPFQEYCLQLAEPLLKERRVNPSDYANLQDRILCGKGERQLYGTQLFTDPETGKIAFQPIADEGNLNERRQGMGIYQSAVDFAKQSGFEYSFISPADAAAKEISQKKLYKELIQSAEEAAESGNLSRAVAYYKKAFTLNGEIRTADLVEAAAFLAGSGSENFDFAFWYLHKAFNRGMSGRETILTDPRFNPLKSDARWAEIELRING